ncbi:MAG: hypothetical protein ACK40O_04825 [Allosphingosinicella sp.]
MADRDISTAPAKERREARAARDAARSPYLAELNARAAVGGHGVDLATMSPEEIRARLFGD